ncbi:MAG: hypothetical protein JO070_05035 [Verrucomicrobia bacterium]|nr:hypothetical protein [Verrucomicrobiota bacterium]
MSEFLLWNLVSNETAPEELSRLLKNDNKFLPVLQADQVHGKAPRGILDIARMHVSHSLRLIITAVC